MKTKYVNKKHLSKKYINKKYLKNKSLNIALICFNLLLSACATGAESFDSASVDGVGAKSISKVNAMIDKGELKGDEDINPLPITTPVVGSLKGDNNSQIPAAKLQKIVLSDDCVVYRQNEEVARIWIAPFQDNSGNFYESSIIHTLLRPSNWQMQTTPLFA